MTASIYNTPGVSNKGCFGLSLTRLACTLLELPLLTVHSSLPVMRQKGQIGHIGPRKHRAARMNAPYLCRPP